MSQRRMHQGQVESRVANVEMLTLDFNFLDAIVAWSRLDNLRYPRMKLVPNFRPGILRHHEKASILANL